MKYNKTTYGPAKGEAMMISCKEALPLMHEFLDGNLQDAEALELKKHLIACPDCNEFFKQLERTEALVRLLPKSRVPEGLTSRVMAAIPMQRRRSGWLRWIKTHPAVSVASVFLLVMLGSFVSLWNEDKDMVVKGPDLDQVVIKGRTVYVPEGRVIDGDLMVQRGSIQVDGSVRGNLIVIDGSYNLASTARISGQIKLVDQTLDWIWYKVSDFLAGFSK